MLTYKSRNKDKHILLFNRSFWPDIESTGQLLTELCEQLAKKYRVTVIVGRSYYAEKENFKSGRFYTREILNGIEILRVRHTRFWKGRLLGRMINWLTYSVLAFLVTLRIQPTMIIACTDPPFLGIVAMSIGYLKSIPFVYYCMDLYPDFALEIGQLKQGFISRVFDYFNKRALYRANLIVSLGVSMRDRLKAKGVPEERIRIIPHWVDTSAIRPISKKDNYFLQKFGLTNKFIVMYSGNIGLSQDFSSILKSIALLDDPSSFYLVFIGEGSGKEALKNEAQSLGLKNVLFLIYQPQDKLSFSLGMADLHLVLLKKGMAGASVPSKVYGIMAAGRTYLAISDKESEPARLSAEFGCGLWAAPQDTKAITKVISWALNHPDELEKMGERGRRISETRFDKEVVIKEWFLTLDNLLKDLSKDNKKK
jgi:glycosyltransferase involved in cell wall biosynthesis